MIQAIILYPAASWVIGTLGDILIQSVTKADGEDISFARALGIGALCCAGSAAVVGIRAAAAVGSAAAAGAAAETAVAATAAVEIASATAAGAGVAAAKAAGAAAVAAASANTAATIATATTVAGITVEGVGGLVMLVGGAVVGADFISRLEKRLRSKNGLEIKDNKLYYMGRVIPDSNTKVFVDAYKEGVL